ncbi:MAG: uracil-DNA glycosylase [Rickettsiales bacterium]|nr:uracil-DNA glycosylase [Rickettsiales bacterium]
MKLNSNITEALQFYLDNELLEVISEKPQNHFLEKDPQKKVAVAAKPATANNFVKPQTSTNEALSILAKKSQLPAVIEPAFDDKKFKSLNEIVALATKAAAAAKTLPELRKAVENFEGCNLKKMATNTVFCDGNPNSKVMVIGEAPGNHEDLQGIPFCGDSGKVLDDMFRAINMTRAESFYVTNVLFWRPPGNRRPTDEELAICRPFVERHIELVGPEVLVLVGATSMTAVLGIKDPVTQIRGRFMDFSPKFLSKKIKTFTIFHPSYLMRQPSKKKVAWQDMLALEEFLK